MAESAWVEIAYAARDRQSVCRVPYSPGLTAAAAVAASDLRERHPELPQALDLGVWGRPVEAGHGLVPGDRVEVYRPLVYDPREERRRRASLSRRAAGS